MLQIGAHKYCLHKYFSKGLKKRWVCSKSRALQRCKATIYTVENIVVKYEARFITSSHGNQMIKIGMYHFTLEKNRSKGVKKRWVCSRCAKGCRSVIFTVENEIVKYKKVQFIKSSRGNEMLQIGAYKYSLHTTYNESKKRWVCSKTRRCRATVITVYNAIVKCNLEHNHI
ncbi:unnamed protein product [Euphydryas editha]|uniref:FLYWCH-type domain-containing protein n=1 Tax=Euphydryas editha TaxID=104508 RepID=A0AAU9THV4_EUPED|nr:unnamed protein product [Euphydryas editha]